MPRKPAKQNSGCRLISKNNSGAEEWHCNGVCESCGHDEREYQRRIKYIHYNGLSELRPGLYGLKLREMRGSQVVYKNAGKPRG